MATFEIPEEGMKVLAVVGYIDQKPIWRQAGKLTVSSRGNPTLYLEGSFNLAGIMKNDPNSPTVQLSIVPFSQEEIQKQNFYKEGGKRPQKKQPSPNFDDPDDDIPF